LALLSSYALWLGLISVWEKSGVSEKISLALKPLAKKIFKTDDGETLTALSMNLSVNLLGVGGAATPYGIKAANLLDKTPQAEYASAMLFVINATSIQLVPTAIVGVRASLGSVSPADIILPSLIETALSTLLGIDTVKQQDGSFTVTAQYDNGFRREITHGIYTSQSRKGTRISYTENGVTVGGTLSADSEIGHFYSQSYLARIRSAENDNYAYTLKRTAETTLKQASVSLRIEKNSSFDPSYIALCNTVALTAILLFLFVKSGFFHRIPVTQKANKKHK
jgi:spore maturation protein A